MRKMTKRSAIVTAVAVAAVGAGAAAWAANGWQIGGEGSAEAKAAEIIPLKAEGKVKGNVYPGFATTIDLEVDNRNEFPVQLSPGVKPTTYTVTPNTPDCYNGLTGDAVKTTNFPGDATVPAKQKKTVVSNITIGSLPQACAGRTIKVNYTFTAESTTVADKS